MSDLLTIEELTSLGEIYTSKQMYISKEYYNRLLKDNADETFFMHNWQKDGFKMRMKYLTFIDSWGKPLRNPAYN